jgi:aromatic-L-amino-acid decarboxylase
MKRPPDGEATLDPSNWPEFRALGHRMLDDMLDYVEQLRERPVWQHMPDDVRQRFRASLPQAPTDPAAVYDEFAHAVVPYALGNMHPGFMGWVQGGGTPVGMLAEMLAAGLNANVGGRDHSAVEVERQVVEWMRQVFEFPPTASGLFVTGTSMANLLAVLIARTAALGASSRKTGVDGRLRAYTSRSAHGCVAKAVDAAGLGTDALRIIATDPRHRMEIAQLRQAIAADRAGGLKPFLVIASAGTVDTGAVDDLAAISALCREEGLWFHIDGAFGALAKLSPELAPLVRGIEAADSIAFDFHKWGQVPYDAGFLLVRDGARHLEAFASPAAYLRREARGMAAGAPWPCDLGIDLSRGARALKTWFTLKTFGLARIGAAIARSCELARYLEERIAAEPKLELLAPAQLNIVCYRYRAPDADRFNAELAIAIQQSGIAAPSTTIINGHLAIRACITNHRTQARDIDALVEVTLKAAADLAAQAKQA